MRKTLHTLPLPLAATAHAATVHFRERDALRAIKNAGLNTRTIEMTIDSLVRLLVVDELLSHRDIEARLTGSRRRPAVIRLAIKLAWERGTLVYLNNTSGWNKENRQFALTSRLYPGLNMSIPRATATRDLVYAYFDRYGPATLKDATWWSGLSRTAVVDALNETERELIELRTDWADSPLYMFTARFMEFRNATDAQHRTGLNFLAHEDVALKAYFETRSRYLNKMPIRRAFNQIGEVLPTVMLDGQLIGTWAWSSGTKSVACSIASSQAPIAIRRQVKDRVAVLSRTLRLGWVGHRCVPPQ